MDLESLARRISRIKEKSKSGKYKYPANIKAQTLKYISQNQDKKIGELSEDLGISTQCLSKWLKSSNIKINQQKVKNSKPIEKIEDTQATQSQFIHVNYEDKTTPKSKVDSDLIEVQLIKFIGRQSQVESILKNIFPSISL